MNNNEYEVLDMEPISSEKKWNLALVLFTVVSFLYVLLCVSDKFVVLMSQFALVMSTLIGCIIKRKKNKVGLLIVFNVFSLVLFALVAFSMYLNMVNMHHH